MKTNGTTADDTPTTDRLEANAHETVDEVAARAAHAEREVRGAAKRTAVHARHLHEDAAELAERVDASLQRASAYVRSNPIALMGIAFAAGVVAACALIRR